MSLKAYLSISLIIFAVVALGHLARLATGWPAQIGPYGIPMSASWGGLVVAAALALWGVTLLRR
jgi:hypothetical protein